MPEPENFNISIEALPEEGSYISRLIDDRGTKLAESRVNYKIDTHILSRLEDSVGRDVPENTRLVKEFGAELFNAFFSGEISGFYKSRLKDGEPMRIRLIFKKEDAELLRVPWEFLHDGTKFLSAYPNVSLTRAIDGISHTDRGKVKGRLRVLCVVSSPMDLADGERLQVEPEMENILRAVDSPVSSNKIDVEFEDEASLKNIQERLDEREYHILHYAGHGAYSDSDDRGYLLLEDDKGNKKPVDNEAVAELLAGYPSLRLVVLSGCQTAKTSGRRAFGDLSTPLLLRGIPSVISMQYSVTDPSAISLARKLYTEVADGKPVDRALTGARKELLLGEGPGAVDFATPVLYTSDPECLATEPAEARAETEEIKFDTKVFLTLERLGKRFIGRRRELRKIKDDFLTRGVRAVVLHGLGGIGKTVTASRAAERLMKHFDYVYSFDCRGGLRMEAMLLDLARFFKLNNYGEFDNVVRSTMPLDLKIEFMAQMLVRAKLLIILDNFEFVLEEGEKTHEIAEPDLKKGLKAFINKCSEGTRFIFTSRCTFNLMDGRLTSLVDEINLAEMSKTEALMVMNRFPEIAAEDWGTKEAVFEKIGGHPYTINIFGQHARRKSVRQVLDEIADVNRNMVEFTLLDRAYESLGARAKALLDRASVFGKAVPLSGLGWTMKDADGNGRIDEELDELSHWGLIVKVDEKKDPSYQVHTVVKDFVGGKADAGDWKRWLVTGAEFYEDYARKKGAISHMLDAHELYFKAVEFDRAGIIVADIFEPLYRWGIPLER
jgi:hypothetical protein